MKYHLQFVSGTAVLYFLHERSVYFTKLMDMREYIQPQQTECLLVLLINSPIVIEYQQSCTCLLYTSLPGTLSGMVGVALVYFVMSALVKWQGVRVIERLFPPVVIGIWHLQKSVVIPVLIVWQHGKTTLTELRTDAPMNGVTMVLNRL